MLVEAPLCDGFRVPSQPDTSCIVPEPYVVVDYCPDNRRSERRADIKENLLIPWKDIPTACGFRLLQVNRRRATFKDKVDQQQRYTKCKEWAVQYGLEEPEFQELLVACPRDINKRGRTGIPKCLQRSNARTQWGHVQLQCINVAIRRAAAEAGRQCGGDETSVEADKQISELSSAVTEALGVPTTDTVRGHSTTSTIACIVDLFELWLRDTGIQLASIRK